MNSRVITWALGAYAIASAATFVAYAWDKHRAKKNAWRVPERTLHTLELLGGWPGAYIAQRTFRHKWQKVPYMRVFWVIVASHFILWIACFYMTR